MSEYITEHNRDNLCDIAWWLKGYKAGADNSFNNCPFNEDHLRTLREVIEGMRDELNKQDNEQFRTEDLR
jgi:ribosome modulation factor